MFFSGKSKQLPYLSEYLNHLVERSRSGERRYGVIGALVGVVGGTAGALLGLLASVGTVEFSSAGLAATIVGINLAAWMTVMGLWWSDRKKNLANTPERKLRKEAEEVGKLLHQELHKRKLHKALNPAAADLLEHSARHWSQIMQTLQSPFWTDPNLPSHWLAVREQSLSAAEQGMDEMLVILKSSFQPAQRNTLGDVIEDAIETYVTGPQWRPHEGLPIGYDKAREIAEKLKLVASAVEKASQDVGRELGETTYYGSGRALDLALGELRTIQEAEEELRQNLGG